MHRVGQVQARFAESVMPALAASPRPVRLAVAPEAEEWIFRRLTHDIPRYRGKAFSPRLRLVAPGEAADYVIREDGRLEPAR
jgi:hypothetical protein